MFLIKQILYKVFITSYILDEHVIQYANSNKHKKCYPLFEIMLKYIAKLRVLNNKSNHFKA